jgi:hypothetical protein
MAGKGQMERFPTLRLNGRYRESGPWLTEIVEQGFWDRL